MFQSEQIHFKLIIEVSRNEETRDMYGNENDSRSG